MTRGAGGRVLRLCSVIVYGAAWTWLLLGMLVADDWVAASVLVSLLVGIWTIRAPVGCSVFQARAGGAAVVAGALWATQPMVRAIDPGPDRYGWPWMSASLLLLPVILAVRERETHAAEWLGFVGWAIGWLPVFGAAATAGGVVGPLVGSLAGDLASLGVLLLLGSTVPFAVVAVWTRVIELPSAVLLIAGAVVETSRGIGETALELSALAGPTAFGAGWVLLGARLLRPSRSLEGNLERDPL